MVEVIVLLPKVNLVTKMLILQRKRSYLEVDVAMFNHIILLKIIFNAVVVLHSMYIVIDAKVLKSFFRHE